MTFPAQFDDEVEAVSDLPLPDPNEHIAGDWGDPDACRDDNTLRAKFAGLAVRTYAERTGVVNEEPETAIGDLLNDLRHLCDALGLDYEHLAARDIHYAAELEGTF